MPKTLGTQGFSGLREEVVRSEGRSSCPPVLQALIRFQLVFSIPASSGAGIFSFVSNRNAKGCRGILYEISFEQDKELLPKECLFSTS